MQRAIRTLILAAGACGGSSTPAPPTPSGPPASLEATPAAPDDPVVATVNGRPIYGSCVTAQAARGATTQVALDECIGFELLAQEAEARGLATDREVVLATRTALVSQLVAREYEDAYTEPADFGTYWDRSVERNMRLVDHPEYRASAYARIPLPKDATPEQDAAARTIAEELAAKLAPERGLLGLHLEELSEQIVAGRAEVEYAAVPPYTRSGLVPAYGDALFALPEPGRTSKAVRTPWGWDVILLTDVIPAETPTPEKIVERMMPEIKRSYFTTWATQIGQSLGVSVKVFDENVQLLEEL